MSPFRPGQGVQGPGGGEPAPKTSPPLPVCPHGPSPAPGDSNHVTANNLDFNQEITQPSLPHLRAHGGKNPHRVSCRQGPPPATTHPTSNTPRERARGSDGHRAQTHRPGLDGAQPEMDSFQSESGRAGEKAQARLRQGAAQGSSASPALPWTVHGHCALAPWKTKATGGPRLRR